MKPRLPAKPRAKRGTAAPAATPALSWDPGAATPWILGAILVLAAFLRFFRFGATPPGLNQDEAINAWNAWCLLKTGRDMTGDAWPVFYSHAIGDNRTTLYYYALLPFQALGGFNTWTTRLPNAVAGMLTVPLAYVLGSRLFGRGVGLAAALVVAMTEWTVFLSRWGIEGGLTPLLALLPVTLLVLARFPIGDRDAGVPRPWIAALAGAAAGIACYGYWPMRLWVAALLVGLLLCFPRLVPELASTREGRRAGLAFLVALALVGGPLALQQITNPAVGQRWEMTRLWEPGASLLSIVGLVLGRYFEHFGPGFLFLRGDFFVILQFPGRGAFAPWLAVAFLIGIVALLMLAFRSGSRSARLLLLLVLIYPAGDLISRYNGVHLLRSSPGAPALGLLAACGLVAAWTWMRRLPRGVALAIAAVLILASGIVETRFYQRYFGRWNHEPLVHHGYQADLVEACRWIRPRLGNYDVVVWTTQNLQAPFAVTLLELGWDPKRWFAEPRDIRVRDGFDVVVRYGPNLFLYGDAPRATLDSLRANGRRERALFVVRPNRLNLKNRVHTVRGPLGDALWLVEGEL